MVWRRRKSPAPPGPTLAELLAPWNDATCPVLTRTTRMERALVSLATHTAQLRKRVDAMEQRVDGRELMMSSAPTRAEMDDLREQSARLARDLARLSIDLREELAKAVDAVRLAQVANAQNGDGNGDGNEYSSGIGNGHVGEAYADVLELPPAEMDVIDLTEVRHTYP
jgi:hypothetical protein